MASRIPGNAISTSMTREGRAERAAGNAAEEGAVLHQDRPIEPELRAQRLDVLGSRAFAEHRHRRMV